MSNYISQYFRDIKKLISAKNKKHKLKIFFIYNRFCLKNLLLTKILKVKTDKDKALGYTIHYDNFNSFFAMFTEIFVHDIYGENEPDSKTPVIVDAGANIGLATIYFKYRYPKSKILSFEPDPGTFEILKKNCESNNLKNVTLYDKALSDKNEKIKFYSYSNFEGSPGNTIHKKWVNFDNVQEHIIDGMTLSSLNLKKIDLLKIDVEGAEGKIIKDLAESGKLKSVQKINLEYHYGTENEDNHLSKILSELEKNKFDYVINPDSLIEDFIPVKKFEKTRKYVAIITCIRKNK